jgi:hypothetical protein
MLPERNSLGSTKRMGATPLRHPRSPILVSERRWFIWGDIRQVLLFGRNAVLSSRPRFSAARSAGEVKGGVAARRACP